MINQPPPTSASLSASLDAEFDTRVDLVMQAVDLHQTHLLHYLTGLTRNYHDAEDLLQSLWNHVLLHFKERDILSLPILRRKAYQHFVDAYRSKVRRPEDIREDYAGIEPVARPREAYSDAEEAQLKANFWSELSGIDLTDQQKECLWLHARFSYSYSEIADRLGIGKSTVGDAITIARDKIKQAFEHQNS
ncbi:RNA polymerase sigma factor [Cerasicoccus frondis]|uniref:RNA polymerase sigma factor n=1 Tax=Cerasicoccus frondis TaxID=490090 RepID=UPI002852AA00|nr:sigma-70 family RNA polymerase sigma factor [Cerasicoccus frondis]